MNIISLKKQINIFYSIFICLDIKIMYNNVQYYIPNELKSFRTGLGKNVFCGPKLKLGTFLHSKLGSGQRAQGGHGGQS
jgi:hypothetical protein